MLAARPLGQTMNELSPNNRLFKLTLPVSLTIIITMIVVFGLPVHPWLRITLALIILTVGLTLTYRIYKRTENLFFDNDFLYLINTLQTRKIKLVDIKRVKLTLTDQRILGMQYYKYIIDFKNGPQSIESVEFWVGGINNNLLKFEEILDYYSPKTEIIHSASSFD